MSMAMFGIYYIHCNTGVAIQKPLYRRARYNEPRLEDTLPGPLDVPEQLSSAPPSVSPQSAIGGFSKSSYLPLRNMAAWAGMHTQVFYGCKDSPIISPSSCYFRGLNTVQLLTSLGSRRNS